MNRPLLTTLSQAQIPHATQMVDNQNGPECSYYHILTPNEEIYLEVKTLWEGQSSGSALVLNVEGWVRVRQ